MARWMFSRGMFSARALCTASLRRKLASASPPPSLAATVISRVSLVKSWPRFASAAPFLRLIVAHLLCPDMVSPHLDPGPHPRGEECYLLTIIALPRQDV